MAGYQLEKYLDSKYLPATEEEIIMGAKKLMEKLRKYLAQGEQNEAAVRCEQIDAILEKLGEKEQKLKKKLEKEKKKDQRKQLAMELRIISLQRKKGIKRRKELEERCE